MSLYGGAFVQALASLIGRADEDNLRRIEDAFPEIIEKYGPDGPFAEKVEEEETPELIKP